MLKFYIFVKINTEREKHCECHLAAVDKVIALLVTQWCLTLHDPMDYKKKKAKYSISKYGILYQHFP